MTALSANRDPQQYGVDPTPRYYPNRFGLRAAVRIFIGAMVFGDSAGRATPGGATATTGALVCLGVAEEGVDNTAGAADAKTIEKIRRGYFERKAGTLVDALTLAMIGTNVYAMDDQTVGATDGGGGARPVAGKLLGFINGSLLRPVVGLGV